MNLPRIDGDALARIESFYGLVPASPESAMNSEDKQLGHFTSPYAYGLVPASPEEIMQHVMNVAYYRDVERLRQENRRLKRAIAILFVGGTITWLLALLS